MLREISCGHTVVVFMALSYISDAFDVEITYNAGLAILMFGATSNSALGDGKLLNVPSPFLPLKVRRFGH